jgi:hypothetical protein
MSVIVLPTFKAKSRPCPEKAVPEQARIPYEQAKLAACLMVEMYRVLSLVGLYKDYTLTLNPSRIDMDLWRSVGDRQRVKFWMSLQYEGSSWRLQYRHKEWRGRNLSFLFHQAHGQIAKMERRTLLPLMTHVPLTEQAVRCRNTL